MAFRSAAYAVVAFVFRLRDANGFTRLIFGPITNFLGVAGRDGYGLIYDDPVWTVTDLQSGVFFGEDAPSSNTANAAVYASGTTPADLYGVGIVQVAENTPNESVASELASVCNVGGTLRVAAVNLQADRSGDQASIDISALRGGSSATIDLDAGATGSEITIACDSLGAWTAFPFNGAVNIANFGGLQQPCAYRRIGDIMQMQGLAVATGAVAAGAVLGTLPVNARPAFNHIYAVAAIAAGQTARLDVNQSGQIITQTALVLNNYISFEVTWYTTG